MKKIFGFGSAICLGLLLCSMNSSAQVSVESKNFQDKLRPLEKAKKDPYESLPPAIKKMMKKGSGVTFMDMFATESGMTGYVLAAKTGERRIFYVPADGKVAILGLMFDANMDNITAKHQKQYINVLEFTDSSKLPKEMQNLPLSDPLLASNNLSIQQVVVTEGRMESRPVFIYVDLASPDFPILFKQTREKTNTTQFVWIPVPGPNTDLSFDLTASVVSAKDPLKALEELSNLQDDQRKSMMKSKDPLKFLNRTPSGEVIEKTKSLLFASFAIKKIFSPKTTTWLVFQDSTDRDGKTLVKTGIPSPSTWAAIAKAAKETQ